MIKNENISFPNAKQKEALEIIAQAANKLKALGFEIKKHEFYHGISGYQSNVEYTAFRINLSIEGGDESEEVKQKIEAMKNHVMC